MGQLQNRTTLQKSRKSFLNEIRGRLLEFSCAKGLACFYKIEHEFFALLSSSEISELQQYQNYLIQYDQSFYQYIESAGNEFIKKINPAKDKSVKSVILTGQLQNQNKFKEADIVAIGEVNFLYSIKLIKENSFINSKSAGIKSIFGKYFNENELQLTLNKNIELYFDQFKLHFFNFFDVHVDELSFVELLKKFNITDRPGQLPQELSVILFDFYRKCVSDIHQHFVQLLNQNKIKFLENIKPLIGFGRDDLNVVTFYHCADFSKVRLDIHDKSVMSTKNVQISELSGHTAFLIELDHLILQIRVKPMNSFLAPSLKVNCSVKFKEKN